MPRWRHRPKNWPGRVAWSQAAAAQGAAIAVDGKMVDRPVLERAQRIVAAGAA
jgi:citrate lyase subunit beta/citryl-CoA lyase